MLPTAVHADEPMFEASAQLITKSDEDVIDEYIKITAIRNVLSRYDSPMVEEAENFYIVAKAMKLDPYMLPSIAGVESYFGSKLIPGTNNPFGWNVGRTPFPTWGDGIATVGYALRHKYYDKGAESMMDVGKKYAGGSTTWAPKVLSFMNKFEEEEARLRRYLLL